jgi:hypothetical protein
MPHIIVRYEYRGNPRPTRKPKSQGLPAMQNDGNEICIYAIKKGIPLTIRLVKGWLS